MQPAVPVPPLAFSQVPNGLPLCLRLFSFPFLHTLRPESPYLPRGSLSLSISPVIYMSPVTPVALSLSTWLSSSSFSSTLPYLDTLSLCVPRAPRAMTCHTSPSELNRAAVGCYGFLVGGQFTSQSAKQVTLRHPKSPYQDCYLTKGCF